jgi:hypothetical protein
VISGDVATDPQYWEDVGNYIAGSGVSIYEQDWLGNNAQTAVNLTDPYAFLGNMAASMAKRNINIQYCMALPKHFLQSTNYSNVTTIRTSQDRFGADKWTDFFYASRFASAIGLWPYSDVFMSTETNNMIGAVLSAGPVGVGDKLGSISKTNILRAARADGVLVKPDAAAAPVDSVFVNDAQGIDVPMVASTYSDFGGLRASYIFAYSRKGNTALTIDPAQYGIAGPAYVYNYLGMTGSYVAAGSTFSTNLTEPAYFVLVPVGASGIALLGDAGHIATLGKQRIPQLTDTGTIDVTVNFAPGETARTLSGFSGAAIAVHSTTGTHKAPTWDGVSQRFAIVVHPSSAGTARLLISVDSGTASQTVCASACVH